MAVPVRSDFLAYNNFPEVYHGEGISKAPKSAAARRVTGECRNTTSSANRLTKTMHIVPEGRHAQGWFVQIRNSGFSDLR
ncbi:hypothetical protein DN615_28125 [Klebsiella pneumoniae]|nr:hypothetical protein DN615_28125 [Klebsiella pneumoniae]